MLRFAVSPPPQWDPLPGNSPRQGRREPLTFLKGTDKEKADDAGWYFLADQTAVHLRRFPM